MKNYWLVVLFLVAACGSPSSLITYQFVAQNMPSTITAGQCIGPIKIDLLADSQVIAAPQDLTIDLSFLHLKQEVWSEDPQVSSEMTFYSDSSCSTMASSFNVAQGQLPPSFYLIDNLAEIGRLSLTSNNAPQFIIGQTVIQVNPGSPSSIIFSAVNPIHVNQCVPVQIQTQDSHFNITGDNLTLSVNNHLQVYSDNLCTQVTTSAQTQSQSSSNDSSPTLVYVKDTATANETATLSATDGTINNNFSFTVQSP